MQRAGLPPGGQGRALQGRLTRPIRVGCSGWNYADWRERVYPRGLPARRWLAHYATLLDTVEVNSTFYRLARPTAVAAWLEQTPPEADAGRLAALLEVLPPGRHCFEFRHPSWFADEVLSLLQSHGAALVIGDHPERPWQPHVLTADWTFVRFHHGARGRRGNHSETELREWAERQRAMAEGADVYAYFNNDWEAFAVRNAVRLRRMVEG